MQTAGGSGEEDNSDAKASDDEIGNTAEDNAQEDFEMKPIQTLVMNASQLWTTLKKVQS